MSTATKRATRRSRSRTAGKAKHNGNGRIPLDLLDIAQEDGMAEALVSLLVRAANLGSGFVLTLEDALKPEHAAEAVKILKSEHNGRCLSNLVRHAGFVADDANGRFENMVILCDCHAYFPSRSIAHTIRAAIDKLEGGAGKRSPLPTQLPEVA